MRSPTCSITNLAGTWSPLRHKGIMLEAELSLLAPVFTHGERYTNGMIINWADVDYLTASHLKSLRVHLGMPVHLIWNVYHRKTDKIDATFLRLPLAQVFMGLTRIECSWGIYSGNSIHVDTRIPDPVHHRWMAVRPDEVSVLEQRNIQHLITNMDQVKAGSAEWAYLSWSHPDSIEGLRLVLDLAESING